MRTPEMLPNTLYMQTLGGFSVQWNGAVIAGGSKSGESQFASLLLILIHSRKAGATRSQLEEFLFKERSLDDAHHALQSVIYNARKKLEQAGLPHVNYFIRKKELFFLDGGNTRCGGRGGV